MTGSPEAVDLQAIKTVLIVKPSSFGDIVHTLPAVHFLKRHAPHLGLTWLANTEWMPLLQENADLDRVLEFPRQRLRGPAGWYRALPWFAGLAGRARADLAIDFQGLLRSALIARASGSRRRFGSSDSREGASRFYTDVIPVDPQAHAVDRSLRLVESLGVPVAGERVFLLPEGKTWPETLPPDFIALHPFSRGKDKSLALSHVNSLARALPFPVVVLGRCAAGSSGALSLPKESVNLLNRTSLLEMIWILRRARFTISVDSGPMHLAAALRPDRLLGIHHWTDPRKVGPYQAGSAVWKAGQIFRQHEVDAAWAARPSMFTDADVAPVAAWVTEALARERR